MELFSTWQQQETAQAYIKGHLQEWLGQMLASVLVLCSWQDSAIFRLLYKMGIDCANPPSVV